MNQHETMEIPVADLREAHTLLGALLGGLRVIRTAANGMREVIDLAAMLLPFRPVEDLTERSEVLQELCKEAAAAGAQIAEAAVTLAGVAGIINQAARGEGRS